jgi:hypothetical protein
MDEHEPLSHAIIEARLGRYRPVGPPPGLRRRILPPAAPRWAWVAAAVLTLTTVGLSWATHRVERRTEEILSVPGVVTSPLPPLSGQRSDDRVWGLR